MFSNKIFLFDFLRALLFQLINYSWIYFYSTTITTLFICNAVAAPRIPPSDHSHFNKSSRMKSFFHFFLFPSNIACCFRYDFFNYVLTSGSKSNMAQISTNFRGSSALTRHRFTVIIQKPRMKNTLILYSQVSIALESKNWILISLSPCQSGHNKQKCVHTTKNCMTEFSLYFCCFFVRIL